MADRVRRRHHRRGRDPRTGGPPRDRRGSRHRGRRHGRGRRLPGHRRRLVGNRAALLRPRRLQQDRRPARPGARGRGYPRLHRPGRGGLRHDQRRPHQQQHGGHRHPMADAGTRLPEGPLGLLIPPPRTPLPLMGRAILFCPPPLDGEGLGVGWSRTLQRRRGSPPTQPSPTRGEGFFRAVFYIPRILAHGDNPH
ncbi:hypothetical protein MTBUT4_160046 [Magnetospirillum sp. UT-4]|nr:hypothetical protein MTBUT4_160046 [Magnetospirillum sp. UT-4]